MSSASSKYLITIFTIFLCTSVIFCQPEQSFEQKKQRIQNQQSQIRDNIGLKYGENTQTITFSVPHTSDFVVKTPQKQTIIAVIHTYWRQQNVYISSGYREGENMRVLVYEDNYKIVLDVKFYMTYGIKFQAEKGKVYTIRFIDEGRVSKLVAIQMTKTVVEMQSKANKDQIQTLSRRINSINHQLKVLTGISEFAIVLHQKNASSLHHSTCLYMTYILIEAGVVLILVAIQVKWFMKLLKTQSIV